MKSTLITIHYDREIQLNNLLRGLSLGTNVPDEVIVINMGQKPNIYKDYNLNLKIEQIEGDDRARLPIGQSRNLGAKLASFETLHFLDVDCIPDKFYIEKMNDGLLNQNGLFMGTPKYLFDEVSEDFTFNELEKQSTEHHKRPSVKGIERSNDAGLFWSLCFSISRSSFKKLGGFDEGYYGYGGEDTDLSFTCKKLNFPFFLTEAVAYHQQHGFYKPPVDKLQAIVDNCNYFYSKWNHWPMDKHLKAFAEYGYVDWEENQKKPIKVINKPDQFSIEQFYIKDIPYA
ncbi:hypothetical protein BST97_02145 [Nonlabens spongiae]|uniref:Galactosyltransferase C-terminal domain-containing protein n=1 Tax=Nonlabens spongiae TaxID=331648 RepID=A0A1W6MH42_9FLAO|nr:galactosyltransferase-related protein [Nonlabens spongiae]ARN76897.1 hypothetical protein BST97_02145 [Nonlabens spongiae]